MRYVFDTNVIISALLFQNRKPGEAFRYALANGEILLSLELLEEISEVLERPKFDRYVIREEREAFLDALVQRAVLVEVVESVRVCRDPKDDKVLEVALNGNASYVITGDQDLLVLNPFREIEILTAEEFLRRVQPSNS
jgi:uncharacterized protein